MNSFVRIAFMCTLATTITANAIGRISPDAGTINVNLTSDFLLTTLGYTGEALAAQQLSEGAAGSSDVPAFVASSSSSSAVLEQAGAADEVVVAEFGDDGEAVVTLNAVNTEFYAAGTEGLNAALHGTSTAVDYAGQSAVPIGGGITIADANTQVEVTP